MKDPLMRLKDLNGAAKKIGKDISETHEIPLKELSKFITLKEVKSLIIQYAETNDDGDILVNNRILNKIVSQADSWVIGMRLAKMGSNDEVDIHYDSRSEEFIFGKTKKEK